MTNEEEQEDSQYMLRNEPKMPSRIEVYGRKRMAYGYSGKYAEQYADEELEETWGKKNEAKK